jgi:hypothetical protein
MYAKLIIPMDRQELLAIPRSAVRHVGQLDTVLVLGGPQPERRSVQLGRTLTVGTREMVQVLSGLKKGERVATPPAPERQATGG